MVIYPIPSNINQSTPAFKGRPMLALPIKVQRQNYNFINSKPKRTFETLTCNFSEMTFEDIGLIKQIREFWAKTTFGNTVLSSFVFKHYAIKNKDSELVQLAEGMGIKKMKCFMLEDIKELKPEARIKGLARVSNTEENNMLIQILQSANENPDSPCIKGVGTALLYACLRFAERKGKDGIKLNSTPDSLKWYSKMGLKKDDCFGFRLEASDFPQVLQKLEKKMGISRLAFIRKGICKGNE